MLRVDQIIGDRSDTVLGQQIHELEHAQAVDLLILPRQDLSRRRFRKLSEGGQDVAVSLPRDEQLFDGAVLHLDQTKALIVRVEAERWLRLKVSNKSAALQLGFHAGNLHWRVRFDGDDLLIAIENELETYTDRLTLLTEGGLVTQVQEEGRTDG